MKYFANTLCCVLIFGISAFSQHEPKPVDTIICYDLSHSGFVEINEKSFNDLFFNLKNNSIFSVPHSITIDGTINTVDNNATLQDINGKKIGLPIIGITNTESSKNTINRMKVISIKDYKVSNSDEADSLMLKAFNPQRIYIPQTMNVNAGDHIIITNYSAFLNDTCYTGVKSRQKAFVFGNFKKD